MVAEANSQMHSRDGGTNQYIWRKSDYFKV